MAVKNLSACCPNAAWRAHAPRPKPCARQRPHAGSQVAAHVTISIGVAAVVPSADARPEQLLAQADAHLYAAKQAGRNQVHAGNHEKVS